MDLAYNNGEGISESAGLLISILMRYPEICAISYNPDDNIIALSFSFGKIISDEQFLKGKSRLTDCLEAYSFLENKKAPNFMTQWTTMDEISVLKVKYDVDMVTRSEIALIIAFLQEEFGDCLLKELDTSDPPGEEDLLLQEEFIGHMLENFKGTVPRKKLIAFRDEGKVHVFKK